MAAAQPSPASGAAPAAHERADLGMVLKLEKLDTNLFRSYRLWKPMPQARAVFGGQIIGQSLVAAVRTVNPGYVCHSMHSYFVLPGDNSVPALYHVDCSRDGKSFATRTVTVRQRGKVIFVALVSFQKEEPSSLEYQDPMPDAPAPELLPTRQENYRAVLTKQGHKLSAGLRRFIEARIAAPIPLDIRNCDSTLDHNVALLPGDPREPRKPQQMLWIRTTQKLADLSGVHQCVAAYASDYSLVSTAALAARKMFSMAASLDHSMWFHAPFRADEWMLYALKSTVAQGGRALIHGRLYTRDGRLAVSIAQEGLLRYGDHKQNATAAAARVTLPPKAAGAAARL
eukprot:TRINITY_DN71872_c0_g1_i1.p1 TRINITY_DN71872_c0_g1~~TRINITY_DN71872_c0_g1_i1.p1  ORF type:complete len:342 (+),score=86.64 TRINITY_DN71872_c0_g1_i1:84-1109(+)